MYENHDLFSKWTSGNKSRENCGEEKTFSPDLVIPRHGISRVPCGGHNKSARLGCVGGPFLVDNGSEEMSGTQREI